MIAVSALLLLAGPPESGAAAPPRATAQIVAGERIDFDRGMETENDAVGRLWRISVRIGRSPETHGGDRIYRLVEFE